MINYAPQLFSGSLDTKTSTYGAGHSYMYDVFRSVRVGRSQKEGLDVTAPIIELALIHIVCSESNAGPHLDI